jgi:hypothetical protein
MIDDDFLMIDFGISLFVKKKDLMYIAQRQEGAFRSGKM